MKFRPRFTLRTSLCLVTVAAVLSSWIGYRYRSEKQQWHTRQQLVTRLAPHRSRLIAFPDNDGLFKVVAGPAQWPRGMSPTFAGQQLYTAGAEEELVTIELIDKAGRRERLVFAISGTP